MNEKEDQTINLVPDACSTILFNCNKENPDAVVSGIHTKPHDIELITGSTYFGFKPYALLGARFDSACQKDLLDTDVSISDVFNDISIVENISTASSFEERIDLFQKFAIEKILDQAYSCDIPEFVSLIICFSSGNASMNQIEEKLGYTEKYCRQKFKSEYGFSPKLYSRILRMQYSLWLMQQASNTNKIFKLWT